MNTTISDMPNDRNQHSKPKQSKLLKFDRRNAKTGPDVYTLSLPAGHCCPGAKLCKSSVDPKTRELTDGPDCQIRCFSASQEISPNVIASRRGNFNLLRQAKTVNGMADLIGASLPPEATKIKLHPSGDFFSQDHFDSVLVTAERFPKILFYAYTKSLTYWIKRLDRIPMNLVLTASVGGIYDELISKHNLRFARIVKSPEEAAELGLTVDHDDSHAQCDGPSFALYPHGQQKAGSEYAAAIKALKLRGIDPGYRRPSAGPRKSERPVAPTPADDEQELDQAQTALLAAVKAAGQSQKVEIILLADVKIDETVSVRANALDLDHVAQLGEAIDELPPVAIFLVDQSKVLVDGLHIFHVYAAAGRTEIPSIVVGTGTIADAQDFSDLANLRHGLRLTKAQRKEVALRLHLRHPSWSARQVSRLMGIAHTTVIAYWNGVARINKAPLAPSSTEAPTYSVQEPVVAAPMQLDSTAITPLETQSVAPDAGVLHQQHLIQCPNCHFTFNPNVLNAEAA